MDSVKFVPWLAAGLIVSRWLAEIGLASLNRRHVLAHAGAVPDAFKSTIDPETYAKSVSYTLAKSRFGQFEDSLNALVLLVVFFSGVLPWGYREIVARLGESAWATGLYLFCVGAALSFTSLPLDWYADFRLEQRFGFNTATPKTWWLDRLKALALSSALGYPLLVLVLKFMKWTPTWWWFLAWATLITFQLAMVVVAPVLILPLFNKFAPLPEGSLRERLVALAQRTGFRARAIEVMDGSRRSRHSNAFFTGLGRFRRIVLFDTLIAQLTEAELEAVLAHEIGHYRKRHIVQMLCVMAAMALAGFCLIAWLARAGWFSQGFGFAPGNTAAALLLMGLLAGSVTFWFSPLAHWWSRRNEFEADAFAAETTKAPAALIGALRKLNERNLSNLTPHPLYSGFYYSHPTLLERERALVKLGVSGESVQATGVAG